MFYLSQLKYYRLYEIQQIGHLHVGAFYALCFWVTICSTHLSIDWYRNWSNMWVFECLYFLIKLECSREWKCSCMCVHNDARCNMQQYHMCTIYDLNFSLLKNEMWFVFFALFIVRISGNHFSAFLFIFRSIVSRNQTPKPKVEHPKTNKPHYDFFLNRTKFQQINQNSWISIQINE